MNTCVDHIYVINLDHNWSRREHAVLQFEKENIKNYSFVDAVNSKDYVYKNIYENIIKNMDPIFVRSNFSIGALGCLLSHIKCIKDARKNNYNRIIVLEDDFILMNGFSSHLEGLLRHVNNNWDFIYLGKKQGSDTMRIDAHPLIHTAPEYNKIKNIDRILYRPSYKTWGTHALLINKSIFDEILTYETNIIAPIDIMLMSSYTKYKFACVKNDLIICDDSDSDIQQKTHDWGWNSKLYSIFEKRFITNIVIVDFKDEHHTHHYIHKMYYEFFNKYFPDLNVQWVSKADKHTSVPEETIYLISPCHRKPIGVYSEHAHYIIHLDEFKNDCYSSVDEFMKHRTNTSFLKNNNYTILLGREVLNMKYFTTNIEKKQICLPWFANHTYEHIMNNIQNVDKLYTKINNNKYICFIGSIWYLNIDIIMSIIEHCEKKQINLIIKGRIFGVRRILHDRILNLHKTHKFVKFLQFKPNRPNENSFEYLDKEYGIKALLVIQGSSHSLNYISNRTFEALSRGHIVITNNKLANTTFNTFIYEKDVCTIIEKYREYTGNSELWKNTYITQCNEYMNKTYGYHNITKNISFLQKCLLDRNILLTIGKNTSPFKVWFTSDTKKKNTYFKNLSIADTIKNSVDSIVTLHGVQDIYIIERIVSMPNSYILCDDTFYMMHTLENMCEKYNKSLTVKRKLDNYCIISTQRSGSTMIIDTLQKRNINYLTLSEVFQDKYVKVGYDINNSNGILHDKLIGINTYSNVPDIREYFKQFEDYAEYNGFEGIVCKYTFDLDMPLHKDADFDKFKPLMEQFKIIVLYRNDMDSFISKHFARMYSYSNEVYKSINNVSFDIKKLYEYTKTKDTYMNVILKGNVYQHVHYDEIVNDVFGHIKIPFNRINDNLLLHTKIIRKQNNFEINELLNLFR